MANEQRYENLDGVVLTSGPDFIDLVMKSIKEAERRGIVADSIIINGNMVYVPYVIDQHPAMICGLNAFVTKDDLPDGYSFAVIESHRERTNAERIRSMSDEELAKFIGHNSLCDQIQNDNGAWCKKQSVCEGCLVEWLKQPAEGE